MADYERSQAAFPKLVIEWRGASERVYKLQYGGGASLFMVAGCRRRHILRCHQSLGETGPCSG